MRAIRLAAEIAEDRKLTVELPADVAEGPAEVIVLIPDDTFATHKARARQLQRNYRTWEKEFDAWVASHEVSLPIPSAESLRRELLTLAEMRGQEQTRRRPSSGPSPDTLRWVPAIRSKSGLGHFNFAIGQ